MRVAAAHLQAQLQTEHCPLQTAPRLQPSWLVVLRLAQKKLLLIFGSALDAASKSKKRHIKSQNRMRVKELVKEAMEAGKKTAIASSMVMSTGLCAPLFEGWSSERDTLPPSSSKTVSAVKILPSITGWSRCTG